MQYFRWLVSIGWIFMINANEEDSWKEKRILLQNYTRKEIVVSDIKRFVFGSCNREDRPMHLWKPILKNSPNLWIWMGDNIYGDTRKFHQLSSYFPPFSFFLPGTPKELLYKYKKVLDHPDYQEILKTIPVIGTWDDHDFGINDGDKRYPYRKESQTLFLDFIGEPLNSTRRQQKGVYTSYVLGKEDQTVKIILLDVRYHKDPYNTIDGDFLGEEQWKWLENELKTSQTTFNIIVSGIQILPNDKKGGEAWKRFPKQRIRLLNTILSSNAKGIILLSGDVHFAEINKVQCNSERTLVEITSSGLTHSWNNFPLYYIRYLASFCFLLVNNILPFYFRPNKTDYYGGLNYGEMEFQWSKKTSNNGSKVWIRIMDSNGQIQLEHMVQSQKYQQQYQGNGIDCDSIHPYQFWFQTLMEGLFVLILFVCFGIPIGIIKKIYQNWRKRKEKKKLHHTKHQ